jgi:hypothetical protein
MPPTFAFGPAGLSDGSPRVQQACVTILSQLLSSPQLASSASEQCVGYDAVMEGVARLLDSAGEWAGAGCTSAGNEQLRCCGMGADVTATAHPSPCCS